MNYILFDGPSRNNLLPFTYTKPVADIRIGILTIREKWELFLKSTTSTITKNYLSNKFPLVETDKNIIINASYLPNTELVNIIKGLKENQAVVEDDKIIAFCSKNAKKEINLNNYDVIKFNNEVLKIEHTWDIFSNNNKAIEADFNFLTKNRKSQPIPKTNNVICPENIFIEEGATVEFATLNASKGSIYIGKNSEIMEGVLIRGPLALCEGAIIKLGAKIYGATTIGRSSRAGGEIKNSVISDNSNKGHEGYLGDSVIGEWCNLGADTNTSNLKNNYAEVRLWNYTSNKFNKTGLQFCGLMMGDHSKSGINTMFNTGTVVGVSANVFGSGFPRNFIPSFSWGGHGGLKTYSTKNALNVAEIVFSRKKIEFTAQDKEILETIFEETKKYRIT